MGDEVDKKRMSVRGLTGERQTSQQMKLYVSESE